MTTGPLPRIKTEAGRSVIRHLAPGLVGAAAPAASLRRRRDEAVEHRERIERSGRTLGVVLDGLDRQLDVSQALDGSVVQVDLADGEARSRRERFGDDLD